MTTVNDSAGPPPVGALSLAGFCKLYNIGKTRAYEELATGRLAAKKIGRKTVILRSEAVRWANALPTLGAGR